MRVHHRRYQYVPLISAVAVATVVACIVTPRRARVHPVGTVHPHIGPRGVTSLMVIA